MATHVNTLSLYDQQRRAFGVGTLRLFGGLQIGAGGIVFLTSIAGIVFDGINENRDCDDVDDWYNNANCRNYWDAPALLGLDIPCLILSAWFFIVGCLPFCMSDVRINSWRCLKIAFMVCNIVSAAFVMPTVLGLGVSASIIRSNNPSGGLAIIPGVVALIGIVEMVLAIVAASYCCCCSSFGRPKNNAGLVFVTTDQQGNVVPMPQSQIPPQYIASGQLAARQNTTSSPHMGQIYQISEHQLPGPTFNNYNTFTASGDQPPPYKSMQERI